MTTNEITLKIRTKRSCTTSTPLCQVRTLCLEKRVAPCSLLLTIPFLLLLKQQQKELHESSSPMMTTSQVAPSSVSIHTWMTTRMDESTTQRKVIPLLPPLLLQKQRRSSAFPCRELRHQRNFFVSHLVSVFQIGNFIVWLIVMFD